MFGFDACTMQAIYMNLKWKFAFNQNRNVETVFWTDYQYTGILHEELTLMVLSESIFNLKLYETNNFRFLKIPFTKNNNALDKNDYSMLIALPISNSSSLTYTEFNQAVQLFSNQNHTRYSAYLKSKYPNIDEYVKYNVQLFLPKMTVKTDTYKLKDIFKSLGMTDAFDQLLANFEEFKHPNSVVEGNLYIGDVYHQTFFEMKEKGVEAAAATVVTMMAGSAYVEPTQIEIPFRVDHPFYFSILAEEKVEQDISVQKMLFLGKVNCIDQVKCQEIED